MGEGKARTGGRLGWVRAGAGVEMRPLVEGEGTTLALYRLAPGARFAEHHHTFPEFGTIILGGGTIVLEEGPRRVVEGDSYYVPSGVPHGFETGPGAATVILHVASGVPPGRHPSSFRHLVAISRWTARSAAAALRRPRPAR